MKLTSNQVKAFFCDDITIADIDAIDLIEHDSEECDGDTYYTLVVKIEDTLYKGQVRIWGTNESGYHDYPEMNLKVCKPVSKTITIYETVD